MKNAFVEDATLEMVVNTGAISFPPEWWLEPRTQGPGSHSHAEDDLFHVIEGTMSVLAVPGPFEPEMPGIAEWFARNPPKDTGT